LVLLVRLKVCRIDRRAVARCGNVLKSGTVVGNLDRCLERSVARSFGANSQE
jgi:hypothetical protein